jgi:hypothetical protein
MDNKITLSKHDYNLIKKLFKAVLPNSSREVLNCVYYDSKFESLVVTDCFVLRVEKCKLDISQDIFFDRNSFKNALKENSIEIPYRTELSFPNYREAIPKKDRTFGEGDTHFPISCFNINTIKRFFDSIVFNNKEPECIFVPTKYWDYKYNNKIDETMPVKVFVKENSEFYFKGIIMPYKKGDSFPNNLWDF